MTEQINTEPVPMCPLCDGDGRPLYWDLRDHLFGTAGVWSFSQCVRCDCVWLNPRPCKEDLHKAYRIGYTHYSDPNSMAGFVLVRLLKRLRSAVIEEATRQYLGIGSGTPLRLLGRVPPVSGWVAFTAKFMKRGGHGRLLDIGCGNGAFLALMREAGWDVIGVEADPQAVRVAAEQYRVPVIQGTIEDVNLLEDSLDAITMDNVIEHVPYPLEVLRRCFTMLRSSGVLVIKTPNTKSLGHKVFKQRWGPLLPPQHLVLFSPVTLRRAVEASGFRVKFCRTSSYAATSPCNLFRTYFADVRRTRHSWKVTLALPGMILSGLVFQAAETVLNSIHGSYGEEIGILAVKAK